MYKRTWLTFVQLVQQSIKKKDKKNRLYYRHLSHRLMGTDSWNARVKTQLCVSFRDPCHPPRCVASLSGKMRCSGGKLWLIKDTRCIEVSFSELGIKHPTSIILCLFHDFYSNFIRGSQSFLWWNYVFLYFLDNSDRSGEKEKKKI